MRVLLLSLVLTSAVAAELVLRNGSTQAVEVRNSSFTIHTAYGAVTFATSNLAQVQFGAGGALDTLVTRGANRLSGFIHDPVQLAANVVKSDCRSIVWTSVEGPFNVRFVTLVNGDCLSGDFTFPDAAKIELSMVESIWFKAGGGGNGVAQLINGKEIPIDLKLPSLKLVLQGEQSVNIPGDLLKTVYLRAGAVPEAVHRLKGAGTGSEPAFPGGSTNFVWIPPGKVLLGSPPDEKGRNSDEGPRTEVTLTHGFWMGRYEVTQGEYAVLVGQNPSTFPGPTNRPVEKVSWQDAMDYCARLTERARGETSLPEGYVYRLPTEAEWEYACRAGTTTRFSFGDDSGDRELPAHGWFAANSGWSTQVVGQLKPNPWGLYDMHGNVLEWCLGLWNEAYPGGQVTNYVGASNGWLHAARGGSWLYGPAYARSANRDNYGPENRCSDLGFRVVLGVPVESRK